VNSLTESVADTTINPIYNFTRYSIYSPSNIAVTPPVWRHTQDNIVDAVWATVVNSTLFAIDNYIIENENYDGKQS
jgi:hypothetical protein